MSVTIRCAVAAFALAILVDTSYACCITYSGPVNIVLGGFPETPLTNFFVDPLEADFAVASTSSIYPSGNNGGVTYLTGFTLGLVGDGSGNIANFQLRDVVDTTTASWPTVHMISDDESGYILTGYDFGGSGDPATPWGQYFNETAPQDYYWAFNFMPDGTLGDVSGWMRVTINPVVVDSVNETLSGGELIIREFAWYQTGQELVVVGQIPEPTSVALILAASIGFLMRRCC